LPGGIVGFGAKTAAAIRSKLDFSGDPDEAEEKMLTDLAEASSRSKPTRYYHFAAGLSREHFICLSNSLKYKPTHFGNLTGEAPDALEDYNIMLPRRCRPSPQ
jgi:hypothetical protein